ncbi:MAG TPA: glycosyltransferase family 9 protein [Pirellulales bacterium]
MDQSAPRILIVRLSAIGDTVLSMPVLCALRERFPQATIGWIVEKTSAALLRGHADLDHLIVVPRGWLKSPKVVWQTVRQMRAIGFDISLDLQGLTKSAVTARMSGAKRRLGFTRCVFEGRELSSWINAELVEPTAEHVVDRGLELLKPLGIEGAQASDRFGAEFRMPRYEEAVASMTRLIVERGLGAGFVVVNTGAGWPSKLWPAQRYAEVARYLGKRHQLPTIVTWAGRAEQAVAHEIIIGAGGHAHMAPPTSLTELAELARRAKLFVGSDTGPLHIAAAVGTPCVGLYGPMPAARCGPYGKQHIALQNVAIVGKVKNRRRMSNESMLAIGVDDVCAACDTILSRRLLGLHKSAGDIAPKIRVARAA